MVSLQAESIIPTEFGDFRVAAFSASSEDKMPHVALIAKGTDLTQPVNVRLHSECITGEVFHSHKCDCGRQLDFAMQYMQAHGGIIIYLRQEGRGIGLINKLKAYALQEHGMDTVEANLSLGLPADGRDFQVAVDILQQLGVTTINLLTNNPEKLRAIQESPIILKERIPLQIASNPYSEDYLRVKKDYFHHLLKDESPDKDRL